eukprot:Rmarinus@m.6666
MVFVSPLTSARAIVGGSVIPSPGRTALALSAKLTATAAATALRLGSACVRASGPAGVAVKSLASTACTAPTVCASARTGGQPWGMPRVLSRLAAVVTDMARAPSNLTSVSVTKNTSTMAVTWPHVSCSTQHVATVAVMGHVMNSPCVSVTLVGPARTAKSPSLNRLRQSLRRRLKSKTVISPPSTSRSSSWLGSVCSSSSAGVLGSCSLCGVRRKPGRKSCASHCRTKTSARVRGKKRRLLHRTHLPRTGATAELGSDPTWRILRQYRYLWVRATLRALFLSAPSVWLVARMSRLRRRHSPHRCWMILHPSPQTLRHGALPSSAGVVALPVAPTIPLKALLTLRRLYKSSREVVVCVVAYL